MDLPLYFPTDLNRRLVGLQDPHRKKFSVVFQDFGRCGHVDVNFSDSSSPAHLLSGPQPVYTAQRQHNKQSDRSRLCAQTPTLPLSDTPLKVHYPFHDRVMGNLPQVRSKVTRFTRSLTQVASSRKLKTAMWSKTFLTGKRTLDAVSNPSKVSPFQLNTIEQNLPKSVRHLADMYTDLSQRPSVQAYNSRYSGGLLSCVTRGSGSDVCHFLLHAVGRKLNRLTLTRTCPSERSHLLTSRVLAERKVESMYQVDAASIQERIFIGARHENSCSMFSVPASADLTAETTRVGDSRSQAEAPRASSTRNASSASSTEFTPLSMCRFDARESPTSLIISPYLPGEALLCTDNDTVYLWSAEQGVQRMVASSLRFDTQDTWLHAHFGSHPRHVAVADRTAVRLLDHRSGFRASVDLFALPSPLVHAKERIMAAHHHHGGDGDSPLHVVATAHCLFVVDQRFGGTPVLQWHPDLKGPVQYLTSADYFTDSGSGGGGGGGVVLAGSQHPAEVMCYPFSHGGSGRAVTAPLNPWRLSRMSDVGDTDRYDCFLGSGGGDATVLHERLGLSLAGMAVAVGPTAESLVTYQADCYGEVYFQQYSTPQNPRLARKTGVPAPGTTDRNVPAAVQGHVRSWLQRLQEQVDSASSLPRKSVERKGRGMGSYLCGLIGGDEDTSGPSASEMSEERCCFCGDDSEALGSGGDGTGSDSLLCPSCRLLRRNFYSGTTASATTAQSRQGWRSAQSPPDSVGDCIDGGRFSEGPSSLEGVAPPVRSYETDANTNVLFRLMEGEPGSESELLDLVKEREEQRARLLEEWKEEIRSARERRKLKRQAADADFDLPLAVSFEETWPKHSVFNSEEHQRQNSRIKDILSMLTPTERPVTIPRDVADGEVTSDFGSENTAPGGEHADNSFDLFEPSSEEESSVQTPHALSRGDDDDEFFISQGLDLDVSKGISGSPAPSPPERERKMERSSASSDLETTALTPCRSESLSLSRRESSRKLKLWSPVLNRPETETAWTMKTPTLSSQEAKSVSAPRSKPTFATPSRLGGQSPSGTSISNTAASARKGNVRFPQAASPTGLVAQTLNARSPNVLMSPPASPHQPSLTASSEKRKPQSAKKCKRLLLSGF